MHEQINCNTFIFILFQQLIIACCLLFAFCLLGDSTVILYLVVQEVLGAPTTTSQTPHLLTFALCSFRYIHTRDFKLSFLVSSLSARVWLVFYIPFYTRHTANKKKKQHSLVLVCGAAAVNRNTRLHYRCWVFFYSRCYSSLYSLPLATLIWSCYLWSTNKSLIDFY